MHKKIIYTSSIKIFSKRGLIFIELKILKREKSIDLYTMVRATLYIPL